MKKLLCVILSLLMLATVFTGATFAGEEIDEDYERYLERLGDEKERDKTFWFQFEKINWDREHKDNEVIIRVYRTRDKLTVEDFPLLDLASVEDLSTTQFSPPEYFTVYRLVLNEGGEDKVKEALEIIGENYKVVEFAHPNFTDDSQYDSVPNDPYERPEISTMYMPNPGDVDTNRSVTILDALILAYYVTDSVELTPTQRAYADPNEDGEINILDAIWIARDVVGYEQ